MHWEGKTLRMLPEDFQLKTNYDQGLDWPITAQDLWPYYRQAEYEIGVSGNAAEQRELGISFEHDDYVFPMKELPPSYLDKQVGEGITGMTVPFAGGNVAINLSTFPQGRNSVPHPDYKNYNNGYTFVPDGVASKNPVEYGERCQGNANCVSICPVQAKYDARKTLNTIAFPERVHLLAQAVASQVEIDAETGRVTAIQYKHYQDKSIPDYTVGTARGRLFVLAAGAVENAKLMLMSNLPSSSGLMGCNLMDHPFLLAWGLLPKVAGTMRGPLVTSGIANFRRGEFRSQQCAFGVDIHNDGWGWSGTGASDIVREAVEKQHKYGAELRQELIDKISRQLLLAFMCELPADSGNRVTIDPRYKDQLGIYRPVIHFNLPEYCKKGIAECREISKQIFAQLGAEDHTEYKDDDPAYYEYEGQGYWFRGGNHFSGTHIMGTSNKNSVVDVNQCSWDHQNLYLLGAGSMPSIGTSNTTLSIAALAFKASEKMLQDLNPTPVPLS